MLRVTEEATLLTIPALGAAAGPAEFAVILCAPAGGGKYFAALVGRDIGFKYVGAMGVGRGTALLVMDTPANALSGWPT